LKPRLEVLRHHKTRLRGLRSSTLLADDVGSVVRRRPNVQAGFVVPQHL
jgi:hypothetical protein